MDCYIYYKTSVAHQDQVLEQVQAMQEFLHRDTGIQSGLQRRPEVSNGMQTWMEIYRQVPDHFITQLSLAMQQTCLLSLIHGERHPEFFMEIIPCV